MEFCAKVMEYFQKVVQSAQQRHTEVAVTIPLHPSLYTPSSLYKERGYSRRGLQGDVYSHDTTGELPASP